MAALSCDLEKASIKTKFYVNVKRHGPIDIYKYNKWIFIDAYFSKSNKTIMLLSNSYVRCLASGKYYYCYRLGRTK
jgi:hypothetical protein